MSATIQGLLAVMWEVGQLWEPLMDVVEASVLLVLSHDGAGCGKQILLDTSGTRQ